MWFSCWVERGRSEERPLKTCGYDINVNVVGVCGRRESRCAVTPQDCGALGLDCVQAISDSTYVCAGTQ